MAKKRGYKTVSIEREVKITCPHCDAVTPFNIWLSVNTDQDPDLKEKVRDQSLFEFECPYCGQKTVIDYGMLYHQPDEKVIVHYAITQENADEVYHMLTDEDKRSAFSSLFDQNYLIRIVRSRNSLLEKLAIFDAKYDDRMIEIYKHHLELAYRNEHPDCESVNILFFTSGEGVPMLQIFEGDETKGVVPLDNASYYDMLQRHGIEMKPMKDDSPIVDQSWVDTFLSADYYDKPAPSKNFDYEIN